MDLPSARNELRWLREHVQTTTGHDCHRQAGFLRRLCRERARGKPLQYLIGNQPFGDLEILTKPGVLIPRPETELYTEHVAKLLLRARDRLRTPLEHPLRILDLCTGTGCIALLLYSLLHRKIPNLQIIGIDKSPQALKLAKDNLQWNIAKGNLPTTAKNDVNFQSGDLLAESPFRLEGNWDLVISNPPYISPTGFARETSRSARNWEPTSALVPPHTTGEHSYLVKSGDTFYPSILEIAKSVQAKAVVMEVDGFEQAFRVGFWVNRAAAWNHVEYWRDDPSTSHGLPPIDEGINVVGSGMIRSVVCWKDGYFDA
ncbi:hypothetical protein MMC25_005724 [Agyrium rufum]|nr:hypothetical protein [Agyrium rufum]